MKRKTGNFIRQSTGEENFSSYMPMPLPPNPRLKLDNNLCDLLEKANRALGKLDGVSSILPDASLFIYFYVRKEAVLSSQIEGTQSSLSDLLLFENEEKPGVPLSDVQEVSNYVSAMNYGIERIKKLPLSLRLIKEIHKVLLSKGRGSAKSPGEFRRSQNWVGGSRPSNAVYVPPPPEKIMECLGDFENFLHSKQPLLIKAAFAHVQFESIHPFYDGNGRVGRLLITFILFAEKALTEPLLYLSLYFKKNRQEYYDWLQKVRTDGDWEGWVKFFLIGVYETSNEAVETAREARKLFEEDRRKIEELGRTAGSATRLHHLFQKKMLLTTNIISKELDLSPPTIYSAVANLEKLGIVSEMTGKKRGKLFVYTRYLKIFNKS